MKTHSLLSLAPCAFLLLAAPLLAADTSVTTGVDYSTGEYGGATRSESLSASLTGNLTRGPFSFGASTSYLRLSGAGVSIPGLGPVRSRLITVGNPIRFPFPRPGTASGTGSTTSSSSTQSGWGDFTLNTAWRGTPFGEGAPGATLGFDVKLGTADAAKGLGSGETDYTFRTGLNKSWGNVGGSVSLNYRFFGEPDGVDLHNGLQGSVDGWVALTDQDTLSASLSLAERTSAGVSGAATATLSYTRTLRAGPALNLYALAGLSDASPDFGTGASISFSF